MSRQHSPVTEALSRQGYHQKLDGLKTLRDESRNLIASLQGNYKKDTGIDTLKIKHNNVLGLLY